MENSGKFVPGCDICFDYGLLWVAFDEKENAIDLTKDFESSKKPVPQLAPCVCHKGHKQSPTAKYEWRKRNSEHGLPDILGDGTKGRDSVFNRIDFHFVQSHCKQSEHHWREKEG